MRKDLNNIYARQREALIAELNRYLISETVKMSWVVQRMNEIEAAATG